MPTRPRLAWAALPAAALVFCAADRRGPAAVAADPPADKAFEQRVIPLLKKYCYACHDGVKQKGGVQLDAYTGEAHARKDRTTWESVHRVLGAGDMPPAKKPQPTKEEKEILLKWIDGSVLGADCTGPKDPGRV